MDRFTKVIFNANGSWTCPAGITRVLVWGMGGGASGGSGGDGVTGFAGSGGVGQSLQVVILNVVPNTTYSIIIGAGGAKTSVGYGNDGGSTSFGGLITWPGAPRNLNTLGAYGVFRYKTIVTNIPNNMSAYARGGETNIPDFPTSGYPARDSRVASSGAGNGGGGSGMGGESIGGAGGAENLSGIGFDGADATANSGAGGGGGGEGTIAGSFGGAGGSGQLIIMYVE